MRNLNGKKLTYNKKLFINSGLLMWSVRCNMDSIEGYGPRTKSLYLY